MKEFSVTEAFERSRKRANEIDPGYVNQTLQPPTQPIQAIQEETAPIPEKMEIPKGDVFAVYRRSNKAHNKPLLFNLPENEAKIWTNSFNLKEKKKRDDLPEMPAEVFFFDYVKQGTDEESVFYNPPVIIL